MSAAHPDPSRARLRTGLGAVVVLVLVAAAVTVFVSGIGARGPSVVPSPTQSSGVGAPEGRVLLVHVLGAVRSPGIYELAEGSRTVDAIALAGGFAADADEEQLNLAQPVADGQQLRVPRIGEAPPVDAAGGSGGESLVNLNTADASALEALPDIGPATASAILEWREANGGFQSVDDLLAVPGIGEKTLAGLRDLVTV